MKHLNKSFHIKIRQGLKADLTKPETMYTSHIGEPFYTTDTKELFISDNDGGLEPHEMVKIGPLNWDEIGGDQTSVDISGFNNDSGYLSEVYWSDLLGEQDDVNVSGFNNDIGYLTYIDWGEIGGDQTDVLVSGFTNDAGYLTSATLDVGWGDLTGSQSSINLSTIPVL